MNIFESCPIIENDDYLLRFISKEDVDDLLEVYSDTKSLPYFNSDNCDGDIFYYNTREKMENAVDFWLLSYTNKWFVRYSIIDKSKYKVIGTVELCLRVSEDDFNNKCILRVDVSSKYENENALTNIFGLVTPKLNELVGGNGVISKANNYAVERIKALSNIGYHESNSNLVGKDGTLYDGYWIID